MKLFFAKTFKSITGVDLTRIIQIEKQQTNVSRLAYRALHLFILRKRVGGGAGMPWLPTVGIIETIKERIIHTTVLKMFHLFQYDF